MKNSSLAFVDVETTGMSPRAGHVIEVAILRIENHQITNTFQSLINHDLDYLPYGIQRITGITPEELWQAPSFYDVHHKILELTADAQFVAHNVGFDYSFLKQEFQRLDIDFHRPKLCTVQLSRRTFPQYRSHSLKNIINRFSLDQKLQQTFTSVSSPFNHHRAMYDVLATWEFYKLANHIS